MIQFRVNTAVRDEDNGPIVKNNGEDRLPGTCMIHHIVMTVSNECKGPVAQPFTRTTISATSHQDNLIG